MTKKDLKKLRNSLPKGFRTTIAEQCNCSVSLVEQVLNGVRVNLDVVQAAVELAASHKSRIDELTNQIKSL